MVSESRSRRQREEAASEELAEQIEAVSQSMAERILGRAIELDAETKAEAQAAAATIDYDTLKDIALEVGISEDILKKALLEELDTDKDLNSKPTDKVTVPRAVRGGILVSSSVDALAAKLERLIADAQQSGYEVTEQRRGGRQLVEVDVALKDTRSRAWRWIIALLIFGPLLARVFASALVLGVFAIGVVAVVGWVKRIARKARRAVNRTLSSLLDSDGDDPDSWLEVWERASRR